MTTSISDELGIENVFFDAATRGAKVMKSMKPLSDAEVIFLG